MSRGHCPSCWKWSQRGLLLSVVDDTDILGENGSRRSKILLERGGWIDLRVEV